jgi:hypothetical protein
MPEECDNKELSFVGIFFSLFSADSKPFNSKTNEVDVPSCKKRWRCGG